ncbi:MAG: hypothetical protein ABID45_01755 [Patescibacteria group bacterium]
MRYTKLQLKEKNLLDEGYADYITTAHKEAIGLDIVTDAKNIADLIDQWYKTFLKKKEADEEVYKIYQQIKSRCEWTALPVLDEDRVLELFNRQIGVLIGMLNFLELWDDFGFEFYFKEKLRRKLNTIRDWDKRDVFKEKLRKAISTNDEKICGQPLKDWFQLYFTAVGTEKLNKIKQAKFLTQNENIVKLHDSEKEVLKSIFNTYEQIKITSSRGPGTEEEFGYEDEKGHGTLQYNQLERYDPKMMNEYEEFHKWYVKNYPKDAPKDEPKSEVEKKTNTSNPQDTPKPTRKVGNIPSLLPKEMPKTKINNLVPDTEAVISTVIRQLKIHFTSPPMEQRFRNICTTFLRGIRSKQALSEVLTRPVNSGGLAYQPSFSDKIITALEATASDPAYQRKAQVSEMSPDKAMPKPTYSQITKQIKTNPTGKIDQDLQYKPKPTLKPKPIPAPKPMPKPIPKPVPKRVAPKVAPAPLPKLRRLAPQGKPMVTDVRSPRPRVMGPVDELKLMNMEEFRNLGASAEERVEEVLEKANVLLRDSVSKKAEGIKAWKQSPVNKVYLDIGKKAILEGKSVEDVINTLQANNQPTLTIEEFDAVADLNKKLRF